MNKATDPKTILENYTRAEMEILFSRAQRKSIWLLIAMSIISVIAIYGLKQKRFLLGGSSFSLFCYIVPAQVIWTRFNLVRSVFKWNSVPLNAADQKLFGPIDKQQFRAMITELLEPIRQQKHEVPNVYINIDSELNAFSINSLLFNFIGRLNAIYINTGLLKHLNLAEVRSILAHEIAHFEKYSSLLSRVNLLDTLFLAFTPVYLYSLIFTQPQSVLGTVLALVFIYLIYVILNSVINLFSNYHNKLLEHLSDCYASERYGKLNMINALLSLGKSSEVLDKIIRYVIRKLKEDPQLPLTSFSEISLFIYTSLNEDSAPEKGKLKLRIDRLWESSEIRAMRSEKKLSRAEQKQRKAALKQIEKDLAQDFTMHDWSRFDTHIQDRKIDEDEYQGFITELKTNPDRQLFASMDDNQEQTMLATHPSYTRRILFIEDNVA